MKKKKRGKEMENVQRRAAMQDFRNFPLYLTGELWNLVEGSDTTVSQLRKVEMLCTYLVNSLGLRHASEPTQSVMVAVICRRMDAAQQNALLQTIKSVLKTTTTRATQTGAPLPGNIYLEQLPASQDQLPASYRVHLATLAIVPVPPGVSLDAIWQAARATPLRSRNQQLALQQAMLGQGVPAMGSMAMQQQQLMTQTAVMMAQAVAGAMGQREMDQPLRNLHIFGSSDNRASSGRGQAVQQMLDRAAALPMSGVSASVGQQLPERSQSAVSYLALGNGSEEPATGKAAAAEHAVGNGVVAVTAPAGTGPGTDLMDRVPTEDTPRPAAIVVDEPVIAPRGQGQNQEIPSKVAQAVDLLAEAHYGKTLPAEEEHRSESKVRMKGFKKPAAAAQWPMKKPTCAQFAHSGSEDAVYFASAPAEKMRKRPAAAAKGIAKKPAFIGRELAASQDASSAKPSVPTKGKALAKTPASATTSASRKKSVVLKSLSEKKRYELQPEGCASCRWRRGCCRSCWAKRGFQVK